jgi:hypothetical protein
VMHQCSRARVQTINGSKQRNEERTSTKKLHRDSGDSIALWRRCVVHTSRRRCCTRAASCTRCERRRYRVIVAACVQCVPLPRRCCRAAALALRSPSTVWCFSGARGADGGDREQGAAGRCWWMSCD